jgi:hypothetical protein
LWVTFQRAFCGKSLISISSSKCTASATAWAGQGRAGHAGPNYLIIKGAIPSHPIPSHPIPSHPHKVWFVTQHAHGLRTCFWTNGAARLNLTLIFDAIAAARSAAWTTPTAT